MEIRELTIRRYRAFDQEVKIPVSAFTVMTGPNNLGKSTVLRALAVFFAAFERGEVPRFLGSKHFKVSLDYPKSYRRGRKWPTKIGVTVALNEAEAADLLAQTGIDVPGRTLSLALEIKPSGGLVSAVEFSSPQLSTSQGRAEFCRWFAANVSYVYIPATRTVERFRASVFGELVTGAIQAISKSKKRVEQVERFYADVAKRIGVVEQELTAELRPYLPDVKSIRLELTELDLLKLLSVKDVMVDDGATTSLNEKGDGFKSVFAMSVLQYIAKQGTGRTLVFAIEEPESHLHASAIYEVKASLESLSKRFQTLVTTHSPVLIDRGNLSSNVVIGQAPGNVFSSTAKPAKNLREIRDSLGIRLQDNMTSAEVIILVEGATEETCVGPVLASFVPKLGTALREGRARVVSAGSASRMAAVLRVFARDVVACVVLHDADESGKKAANDLLKSGLIGAGDLFAVPSRDGALETEFEDAFPVELYIEAVVNACGIAATEQAFVSARQKSGNAKTKCQKWSRVMESLCSVNGKDWPTVEGAAKTAFADALLARSQSLSSADYPWLKSLGERATTHLK